MKLGTKSVLFGAHCFLIHPIFVAIAWIRLYGFPFDPRIWIAFFVHDLGYWGKPNMDGPEGETHVEFGAKIMAYLFDFPRVAFSSTSIEKLTNQELFYWSDFSKYHSRFYAKKDGRQPSKLCFADKMAICLEPAWLYLPRVNWSGEIVEYMKLANQRKYEGEPVNKYESMKLTTKSQKDWFDAMVSYMNRWIEEHKDGKLDTWTPASKTSINQQGVYQ